MSNKFLRPLQYIESNPYQICWQLHKVTGRIYNIRGKLTCNIPNVVYLISCSNCYDQDVGSALDFKSRFRIHKSDIKTKKDRCGTARHFNTKCTDSSNPHKFLKAQIIESVQCDYNLVGKGEVLTMSALYQYPWYELSI